MPWKETHKMDERRKFVARLLEGEKMSDLCVEFDISRKTGYKIYDRFMQFGIDGLLDQSRRPKRLANLLDSGLSTIILGIKKNKPTWGAPKIRELLIRKFPTLKPPAVSTIHALFDRNGLVNHKARRTSVYRATGTYLSQPKEPNDLWCTDFKGQFRLGDNSLCYPLTITDQVSRTILEIEAMEAISEQATIAAFRGVFSEYGLPNAIRSDNGVPFSSRSLHGLSMLSVWWLRLGIKLERIIPGNPQQNGIHERMHKTLKLSVTRPPAKNIISQQEKFNAFKVEFNDERPHEGIAMKTPTEVYKKSTRPFITVLNDLDYPTHDFTVRVTKDGDIRFKQKHRIFIGTPLCGQNLGIREIDQTLMQVSFMDYEIGFFDLESNKFNPGKNPFSLEQ